MTSRRPLAAVVLACLAIAYALLEDTYANDLFISLAAGRQILARGEVPLTDSFSYPFAGRPWFNQNWLSHVVLAALHDRVGPDAVIVGCWLAGLATFGGVFWLARRRGGSTALAALLTAGAAFSCRQFIPPRAATFGLLCLAGCVMAIELLARPRPHAAAAQRWLACLLLGLALTVWGCAHGSFVFGYALCGLFAASWAMSPLLPWRLPRPSGTATACVVGVATLTVLLTGLFGPLGWENFTHPSVVAGDPRWRTIVEWRPAVLPGTYPPVLRFWMVVAGLAAAVGWARWQRPRDAASTDPARGASPAAPRLSLFDIMSFTAALALALWARRFIPLFWVTSAPVLAGLLAAVFSYVTITPRRQQGLAIGVACAALSLAFAIVSPLRGLAASMRSGPHPLFDWVSGHRWVPRDAIEFLNRNALPVHLMTDWASAGPLMFHCPQSKVFIDGRAQQVYTAEHYELFKTAWSEDEADADAAMRLLDESNTDAILVAAQAERSQGLLLHLFDARAVHWLPIITTDTARLFLREGSTALAALVERERRGEAWWPAVPSSKVFRASLWAASDPPDYRRALELHREAVADDVTLGLLSYPRMARLWIEVGRPGEAVAYFREQQRRLDGPPAGLGEPQLGQLRDTVRRCLSVYDVPRPSQPSTTQP